MRFKARCIAEHHEGAWHMPGALVVAGVCGKIVRVSRLKTSLLLAGYALFPLVRFPKGFYGLNFHKIMSAFVMK